MRQIAWHRAGLLQAAPNRSVSVFSQRSGSKPVQIANMDVGQSVVAAQVGTVLPRVLPHVVLCSLILQVCSTSYKEVVLATFGGRVVSLSTEPRTQVLQGVWEGWKRVAVLRDAPPPHSL